MDCSNNISYQSKLNLMQQAGSLNKKIIAATPSRKNLAGSETDLGVYTSTIPKVPAITYVFDNVGGGATTRYIIGDPTGMIAAKDGGTLVNPSLVQGKAELVIPHKNFFYGVGVKYSQINYQTSSDSSQFTMSLEHRVTNSAGVVNATQISVSEAKSNVQQNDLLLTLKGEYDLDIHSAYILEVADGEKVSWTCSVKYYVG